VNRDQRLPEGLLAHAKALPHFSEEPWGMLDDFHLLVIFFLNMVNGRVWVIDTKLSKVYVMHSFCLYIVVIKVEELLFKYLAKPHEHDVNQVVTSFESQCRVVLSLLITKALLKDLILIQIYVESERSACIEDL